MGAWIKPSVWISTRDSSATVIGRYAAVFLRLAAVTFVCHPTAALAAYYSTTGEFMADDPDSHPLGSLLGSTSPDGSSHAQGEVYYNFAGGSLQDLAKVCAGPDGLYVSAASKIDGTVDDPIAGILDQKVSVESAATWYDFVITGPKGSGPIDASFNVHMDSPQPIQTSIVTNQFLTRAYASIDFFVQDNEIGAGAIDNSSSDGIQQPPSSNGALSGFDGNGDITTPTFTVPVNTSFVVGIDLAAEAYIRGTSNLSASCDYMLTFANDEPVFNLPAGYTVDCPDANVESNMFVAPEPHSFWMLVVSASFACRLRGRRH